MLVSSITLGVDDVPQDRMAAKHKPLPRDGRVKGEIVAAKNDLPLQ